jgi:predicted membrane channel-forming protein YqfA (hemolysin III family)
MVGVCLTAIGFVRVVITMRTIDTIVDELFGADVLFLVSCILSYWAMRRRSIRRMYRLERVADAIFILALLLTVATCTYITLVIARS